MTESVKLPVSGFLQLMRIEIEWLPADTLDNFEVNGAAHDASPSLIFGGSFSSSMSAIALVIAPKSNYKKPSQERSHDRECTAHTFSIGFFFLAVSS